MVVGVVVSVCGELDVVVPVAVPVLLGGVPGCTVVLVADVGDVMSYWSWTGSFGCELGSRSAFGVLLAPSEAVLDTALAWVELWVLLVQNRYGEHKRQLQLRCSALCCQCCCLLCQHAWRCVHCDGFGRYERCDGFGRYARCDLSGHIACTCLPGRRR